MRDAPPDGYDPRAGTLDASGAAADEDFLYHLYRGSEMLLQDRVVEAKSELERALELSPQDAKSQDLLAGVYFRLGVYPRAIEIWLRLVRHHASDAALRVNLALALLKTGQPADAIEHLHVALQIQPDHGRAWGYLGLVHWRLGRFQEARDAFLRGGQVAMARRMEEAIGATSAGALDPAGEPSRDDDADRAAMRSAAEEAIEHIEAEDVTLQVATPTTSTQGSWRTVEPGNEPVPGAARRRKTTRPLPASAPARLSALVDAWTVSLPEDTPLMVGPSGELFIQATRGLHSRIEGLRAVRGDMRITAMLRRAGGREIVDEVLGEHTPLFEWHGAVAAILSPPASAKFVGLSLDRDDVLYVREEVLWAFDDRISYESGRLPLVGRPVLLTQLWGEGTVVLALERPPAGLRVRDGEEVHVDPARLVGWVGRLFPSARGGTAPYSAAAPPLSFRGEGVVLVA